MKKRTIVFWESRNKSFFFSGNQMGFILQNENFSRVFQALRNKIDKIGANCLSVLFLIILLSLFFDDQFAYTLLLNGGLMILAGISPLTVNNQKS